MSDPASWSTAEAIRHKEIAQARLRQIEADTAAGLVVPIADVAKAVADEYAVTRAALLGMAASWRIGSPLPRRRTRPARLWT